MTFYVIMVVSLSIRIQKLSIRYQFGFGDYLFGINSESEFINSVKCSESFRYLENFRKKMIGFMSYSILILVDFGCGMGFSFGISTVSSPLFNFALTSPDFTLSGRDNLL